MEFILDTADTEAIRYFNEYLTLDGVTTNPTIITRSGRDYMEVLKEIVSILNDDQNLFVQVVSTDYEGILKDAEAIVNLRPENKEHMYVKIPVTNAGLKAIKTLHKQGVKVLATAIYHSNQAYLAAKNGADALAPYVNRMENNGAGIENVIEMNKILKNYGYSARIVAASFKNTRQVETLMANGIAACTIPVDVAKNLMNNTLTDQAVDEFSLSWKKAYNKDCFR